MSSNRTRQNKDGGRKRKTIAQVYKKEKKPIGRNESKRDQI